jgi:hypothetical protein
VRNLCELRYCSKTKTIYTRERRETEKEKRPPQEIAQQPQFAVSRKF